VNQVPVKSMMDSNATHNFVSERVVPKLKLELVESLLRMKAVNSEARLVMGALDMSLTVGLWVISVLSFLMILM
jgi:hypothetical protein